MSLFLLHFYYNDSNNLTHHYANYDDNGDLKDFTICYENGNETTYNKNGEETSSLFYNNDGGYIYRFDNEHSSGMIERDKEGRIITRRDTWKEPWSWTAVDYEYNSKGERIEKIINKDNEKNKHNYYDKNDRLIKSKQFDDTNQLLYTITPKYDQDGDLIKRDTIWVNK